MCPIEEKAKRKNTSRFEVTVSAVKPLSAKWMVKLYDHLKSRPDIIHNDFREAGIVSCFDDIAELFIIA